MSVNKYQTPLTKFIEDGHRLTHRERQQFGAILQELVNKETPMKVGKPYIDDCPKCGEFMIDTCKYVLYNIPFIKYCPHCGQKLDWSDKDE